MNTVIFKWNPAISSYSMHEFLKTIISSNLTGSGYMNWSLWDNDKIRPGDRCYLLKVGYGCNCIVAMGTIVSDPYRGKDWSGKGRKTYYADWSIDMMVNPDAMPTLTSELLTERIPNFDWFGGHSGIVLDEADAKTLNALWSAYIDENREMIDSVSESNPEYNDRLFIDD